MITTSGSLQKPRSLHENTTEISRPCNNPLSWSGGRRRTSYSQLLLSPSLGPLSLSLWLISSGSSCYLDTPFSEKSKKPLFRIQQPGTVWLSSFWLCTHAVACIWMHQCRPFFTQKKDSSESPPLPHGCSFHLPVPLLWMSFLKVGFPHLILTKKPETIVFLLPKQPDNRSYPPTWNKKGGVK